MSRAKKRRKQRWYRYVVVLSRMRSSNLTVPWGYNRAVHEDTRRLIRIFKQGRAHI